ncbi:complement factor H-like isoform X2 [Hemicordylus capensis]|uniref:complement factor H-like isoform X2 n=1 Tax=Hemicordylus capensis TaxID=884348 RepID=UPI002303D7C4|nr:complement factor H-like isoform X2 [Hemicordylus capensis]
MKRCLVWILPCFLWTCCSSQNVCEEPPDIDFGEIISDERVAYQESDRVQFRCNPGYTLEGSEWITCHQMKWTPPPKCLAPCSITTQQLDTQNLLSARGRRRSQMIQNNNTIEFLCRKGYVLTTPSVAKCVDGHINLPSCISERGKNCSLPPTIRNGDIITLYQKQYTSGSWVEFKCQQYYAIEGHNRSFCDNGNWTKIPVCLEPCTISMADIERQKLEVKGSPPETTSANLHLPHGDSVEVGCKSGYVPATHLSQSAFIIQCNGGSVLYPECKEITCHPPRVANGAFIPLRNVYQDGDLIQLICDNGFQLDQNTVKCTRNGWSPSPKCSQNTCGPPPIVHGSALERIKVTYHSGETVNYQCHPGFAADGPLTMTCRGGKWTESSPCEDATCREPPTVDNADILNGPEALYLPNQHVQYQCHEGFEMSGSATIICVNKMWSKPPVCEDVACSPPVTNANLSGRRKEKYLPLETVRFRCSLGQSLFGPPAATCRNKQWTELPKCQAAGGNCGRPPAIENGDFLEAANVQYSRGSVVHYKCQRHYVINGSAEVRCVNGHWTEPPICLVACTITEEAMRSHNIQLRWLNDQKLYTESGKLVEFVCRRGYRLAPSSPSLRALCIEGNLEYPSCVQAR